MLLAAILIVNQPPRYEDILYMQYIRIYGPIRTIVNMVTTAMISCYHCKDTLYKMYTPLTLVLEAGITGTISSFE